MIGPTGWLVEEQSSGLCLGVTGDFGYPANSLVESLRCADQALVHANHGEQILSRDESIHPNSRARLLSRHGHLSNAQAQALALVAELAELAGGGRLKGVLLGHLDRRWTSRARTIAEVVAGLVEAGRP